MAKAEATEEKAMKSIHWFTTAAMTLLVCIGAMAFGPPPANANIEITGFDGGAFNEDGSANLQAGQRPHHSDTEFSFAVHPGSFGNEVDEEVKNVTVELPPGAIGNPEATPKCTAINISLTPMCPLDTQVGMISVYFDYTGGVPYNYPLFNLKAPDGKAALFGFEYLENLTYIEATVRSGADYGINATTHKIKQVFPIEKVHVSIWGVPADSSHDRLRGISCTGDVEDPGACSGGTSVEGPREPFFTNPTRCTSPLLTTLWADSWANQGAYSRADFLSHNNAGDPQGFSGCDQLDFKPTIEARPTTNVADSPSGLDFKLNIPQNEDPDGSATAQLRDAHVTLPAGLTVNPSSANGLGACSPAQIGLTTPVGQVDAKFTPDPANCPNDSKLGTVEVLSPLLDHPIEGEVFLASQNENPFGSLLAMYVTAFDEKSGVVLKLPGKISTDPNTGQITATVDNNPQLPFEDLKLSFFGGPRAALKTAINCGTFTTTSEMVPWTAPEGAPAFPKDSFQIQRGANDGACVGSEAQASNGPAFNAGTVDPTAGSHSPFTLKLTRPDGSQQIRSIDTTLPKGLLGKLAGIPYCSDQALASAAGKSGKAEQASSSCPFASRLGSVTVGAGAGSQPLYVDGKAYLAGPYKGAPLSLAIVTPAVAGPFDLGTVVVRTRLEVNPETAQIKAVSDEIPTMLQGIPLDVRSITVNMDRPSFILNPTSCNPMSVLGGSTSLTGNTASLTSPFQVGGCGALGFKPKLAFRLSGKTSRTGYPALKATLSARSGDANIGRAQVTLPKSQILAQNHIKTICTRVQYAANTCPPASIYGKAKAWSPLLDQPLSGPVYLRSSNNPLPDLVAKLDGQIHIDLVGRIDSVNARLRSTFESVPDAPVSKFVLEMQGGKKGLLVNNTELCRIKPKASVKLDAQSGKTHDFNPVVKVDCGKKKGKKGKGKAKGKKGKAGKQGKRGR
jgi:hypothetical protein